MHADISSKGNSYIARVQADSQMNYYICDRIDRKIILQWTYDAVMTPQWTILHLNPASVWWQQPILYVLTSVNLCLFWNMFSHAIRESSKENAILFINIYISFLIHPLYASETILYLFIWTTKTDRLLWGVWKYTNRDFHISIYKWFQSQFPTNLYPCTYLHLKVFVYRK